MRRFQPDRHRLIASQPAKLPRFTQDGYALREWPADKQKLLDKVLAQVEQNRHHANPGGYDMFNPYVSAWESNVWVFSLGNDLNNKLIAMIKDMLEEWTGEKLQYSLYHGPRIYRKDSVLNMHVDVFQTHVISAIIHLSHRDVKKHWPLEVIDFDGNKQHVSTDRPGQIVLYESAKVLHGRPTPFEGTEYINMFFHFRPIGWQDPRQWTRDLRKKKASRMGEDLGPSGALTEAAF